MKTILKGIIAMSAAMICFSGCDKFLDVDSILPEGVWSLTNADGRVVEDGMVHYTFLKDGKCLVAAYNALDDSENATRYTVCTWSLADDVLTIDAEGGFNYRLSRKSKDKILCTSDRHSVEYYLVKEKGTDYSAAIGEWSGKRAVTMTNNDGVESEHIGFWELVFQSGQRCRLTTGVEAYALTVASYNCFWYPDGASFVLVDDDMKAAYQGFFKSGYISMHKFPRGESIILKKYLLE